MADKRIRPANNQFQRQQGINRRKFLSTAGAGASGLLAGAARESAAQQQQKSSRELRPDERELAEKGTRNLAAAAIPTTSKPNGLNLVVIVADTWRTDHLGAYGSHIAKTPNLDALAKQSVLFEHNYADGLPTIPARRVYHTGKSILPGGHWIPLPAEEVTLAQILKRHGYWCGLIADVYHYFRPDMNMHVDFDTWEWIRGQESDAYLGGPAENFQPKDHMPAELWHESYDPWVRTYLRNTQYWKGEDDYFAAQTVGRAMQWLEMNATRNPFLLWVEIFDPHEPWDAPPRFQKMYRDDYGYERFFFGYGVQSEAHKPNFEPHLPVIRDLYRGEVTFVDHCIGRLLAKLEELNLLDDTIVVFTSDHGTHLGEGGYVQKQPALLNRLVMHVPLMIRHPDRSTAGKRVSELTSAVDYGKTFCSMLGVDDQPQLQGRNMWDLATGKAESGRDRTFTQFMQFAAVRDKDWHYFQHVAGKNRGAGPCLYDLQQDPGESTNVAPAHADVVERMRHHLSERLKQKLPKVEPVGV